MRLERLNYNKIKVFLTSDDLSERGLTKEDLWYNAPKVQQLFQDMMHEASVELGFEVDGKVSVEVFSLQAQGMVVIVTKSDEILEEEEEFQDDFISMEVILDESEHILYEFSTLDDLILLSEKLVSCDVSGGRLFSFENTFYIKFEEHELGRLDRETFYAILAEYGNPSTRTIYRIIEYGKELISENAIKQLHFYFVEKKTSH